MTWHFRLLLWGLVFLVTCAVGHQLCEAQPDPKREDAARRNIQKRGRENAAVVPARRRVQRAGQTRALQDRIMTMVKEGRTPGPQEERLVERYLATNLLRAPSMSAVDGAHYSIAEINLRRGDYATCLERLERVLTSAGEAEDETVWVTHFNIANLCGTQTGDVQRAVNEYACVKGMWAGMAQVSLLRTLEEIGELDQAVTRVLRQQDVATETGEKIALLKRLAELYQLNEEPDKAVEIYDRITKEFTRADVEKIKKDAVQYVLDGARKARQLRDGGQFEAAREQIDAMRFRLATLRAQGRMDEVHAMKGIMPLALDGLEQPLPQGLQ